MQFDSDHLQALHECCQDEDTFAQLQTILTQVAAGQTESRYAAILRAMPDRVFLVSRDGQYLDFQGNESDQIDLKQSLIGKYIQDLLPPDVAELSLRAIATTLDSHTLQTCEYQLFSPDEGLRDYEARLIASGKDEVLAIVRDITERKQTEEALQISQEKFCTAFRCSPHPICLTTIPEGICLDVNEAFLQTTGYSREDVIGRTTLDLNIWVNLADRDLLLHLLRTQGCAKELEFDFRTHSGDIRTVLFSADVINLKDQRCILSTAHDITERKQAEAQLRMAAERDRLLAEIALRIRQSLELDQILNTTVVEVRQFLKADRVLISYLSGEQRGAVIAESVGSGWMACLGMVLEESVLQEMETLFDYGNTQVIENTADIHVPSNEVLEQCQVKAALVVPIVLENQVFGLLIAHQCHSPRRWQPFEVNLLEQLGTQVAIAIQQANLYQKLADLNASLERQVEDRTAQLQQKMQELQELNQLKDVFIRTISHDLRTPVMGSLLVLQNLLKSETPDPTVAVPRSILQRMVEGSDRQLNLINSLLEAHSSEMQGIALHCEPTHLEQLIDSVLAEMTPLAARYQAQLLNQVPLGLPLVEIDPNQLHRVFENLITNALKHNPPGVTITLTAQVEDQQIICTVQDNGVGMQAELGDRLFDLYTRGQGARYSTGIGLGLYLCRQIIRAHRGHIGVESAPGAGAKFWFTLPRSNNFEPQN